MDPETRLDRLEASMKMLGNSIEAERTNREALTREFRDLCQRVSQNHEAVGTRIREAMVVKCNTIDLNSTRKEPGVLIGRVESLESRADDLESRTSGADMAASFEMMSNQALTSEACKVLAGVLDDWEGDNSALADYGEIRCKHLLSELRRRGLETE